VFGEYSAGPGQSAESGKMKHGDKLIGCNKLIIN